MFQRLLCLAILGLYGSGARAQTAALDLIPANASAAILIRNPDELRKKGDEFLKETDFNVGLRPTDALAFVTNFLGINQGLDLDQPAGAVLLRPDNAAQNLGLEDINQSLYIVLAFTDLDKMAANFGFEKGALRPDTIAKVTDQNRQFGQYVLARDKYLYLAATEGPLKRLRKAKGVTGELSATARQVFGSADLMLYFRPEALGTEWAGSMKALDEEFAKVADPQEKEGLKNFTKTLASLRFALAGVRVEEGIGINFFASFPKENETVQAFLDGLRPRGAADLKGLPAARAVAAQAYAGEGPKSALFARAFFNFLLKNFLESKQITSAADRPTFLGIFDEVWQRLQGSRVGVYLTRDESKLGLFSLVAILDTLDAEKFLAEMRTLAKIADGTLDLTKTAPMPAVDIVQLIKDLSESTYRTRASATTRLRLIGEPALSYLEKAAASPPDLETARRLQLLIREISAVAAERRKELLAKDLPRYLRPSFAFVARAETRAGLPIDIVHIKLKDLDQGATRQMQQFFGPDWDKLRLAVHGKQVVAFLGSDVELFETALVNVKEGKAGLAGSKVKERFNKMRAPSATATFHLSMETLIGLVNGQPRQPGAIGLTSFALSVRDAGLQLDMHLPIAHFKALAKENK